MSHFELHPILHRPLNLKFITCCNAARKDKATVKGICRENLAKSGYVVLEICSGKLYKFHYCLHGWTFCVCKKLGGGAIAGSLVLYAKGISCF